MAVATTSHDETSEAAIFSRLWEGGAKPLSVTLARHIVSLGFSGADRARMRELSEKNHGGELTRAQTQELDNFIRVGDLLALLQSKARQRLKRAAAGAARHV